MMVREQVAALRGRDATEEDAQSPPQPESEPAAPEREPEPAPPAEEPSQDARPEDPGETSGDPGSESEDHTSTEGEGSVEDDASHEPSEPVDDSPPSQELTPASQPTSLGLAPLAPKGVAPAAPIRIRTGGSIPPSDDVAHPDVSRPEAYSAGTQGRRESPSLWTGTLRRWPIVLVPALLLMGAGIAVGLSRAPTYTAETQLSVGSVSLKAQSVPGFVEASKSLAGTYSRVLISADVLRRVSAASGLPIEELEERIEGTPIPDTAVIRVLADGSTPDGATGLARTATRTLRAYVSNREQAATRTRGALARFRQASRRAARLQADLDEQRGLRSVDPALVPRERIERLATAADVARLEAEALVTVYQNAREEDEDSARLELVAAPQGVSDDRVSATQLLGLAGLLGGAAIGGAVALLLAARARRRASTD